MEIGYFIDEIFNTLFLGMAVLKIEVVQGSASVLLVQILYIAQLDENAVTPSLSEVHKFSDPGPYFVTPRV